VIQQSIKAGDRVETLLAIGKELPKGSVGVVTEISHLYPSGMDTRPILTVRFPQLAMPGKQGAAIEGLDPDSVPATNALALRVNEVRVIDHLGVLAGTA